MVPYQPQGLQQRSWLESLYPSVPRPTTIGTVTVSKWMMMTLTVSRLFLVHQSSVNRRHRHHPSPRRSHTTSFFLARRSHTLLEETTQPEFTLSADANVSFWQQVVQIQALKISLHTLSDISENRQPDSSNMIICGTSFFLTY